MPVFPNIGKKSRRFSNHWKSLDLILAALLGSLLLSCSKKPEVAPPPPQLDPALVDGQRAFEEARALVELGPKEAGTKGTLKAARYLAEALKRRGVEASIHEFTALSPRGETTFRNVVGRLAGKGQGLIILASHYDTKSGIEGFLGANDSAASSALLLELSQGMAKGPALGPDVLFVFFDGEECMKHYGPSDGLQGSRHMAAQLVRDGRAKQVKAFILLDMVGDRDLSVTVPRNGTPSLISAVFEAAHEENVRSKFSLYPFEIGDDHDPFFAAGMPAVDIIDFHYGSAPGRNDYWHTPEDTLDKISAESLGTVGRVAIRVVNRLL
ncbi:MAG: M28 family metallopeptidase [Verrucomicrobiota bacterium]